MIASRYSNSIDGLDAALVLRLLAMARGRNLPLCSAVEAASGLDGRPRLSRLVARLSAAGEEGLLAELGASLRAGRDQAAAASLEALAREGLPSSGLLDLSRWIAARATERGRFLRAIGYPLSIAVTACFLAAFLFQNTIGLFALGELQSSFGLVYGMTGEEPDTLTTIALLSGRFARWLSQHPAALLAWAFAVLLTSVGVFLYGARIQDRALALWIPGLRRYVQLSGARAFCGTLHALLRSGVPAPEALEAAASTVSNVSLRRRLGILAGGVAAGEGLGELFRTTTALPPFVSWRLWSAYFRSDLVDELSRTARALDAELAVSEGRVSSLATILSWGLAFLALLPVAFFVSGLSRTTTQILSVIG